MRKSMRLLSAVLAVLMLCCSFPLSVLAVSPLSEPPEYERNATKGPVTVSKQDITGSGATIEMYRTFTGQTEGAGLNPTEVTYNESTEKWSGGNVTIAPIGDEVGTLSGYDRRKAYTFNSVNGNMAIKFAGESTGDQMSFFDLTINSSRQMYDVVYHMDVKTSKDPTQNTLFGTAIQLRFVSGSTTNWLDISFAANGDIKANDGTVIGKLSADEFTSIAILVDRSAKNYSLYINGEKMHTGVDFATQIGKWVCSAVRICQINSSNTKAMDNDLWFDNMVLYTKSANIEYNPTSAVSISKQEIIDAYGESSIMLYGTFDNQPVGGGLNPAASNSALEYSLSSPDVGTIKGYDQRNCYTFVNDADGDVAIKMTGNPTLNKESFFDLYTADGHNMDDMVST